MAAAPQQRCARKRRGAELTPGPRGCSGPRCRSAEVIGAGPCPNPAPAPAAPRGRLRAAAADPPVLSLFPLPEQGNLCGVRHVVLVLSGKGGVGKSTVATELALALRQAGKKVGILDVDLCGPSIPRMFRVQDSAVHQCDSGWVPVFVDQEKSISLMSIGFLLEKPDDAVVWRGPKKNALIKQFVTDVAWGDLDFLIVDTPPGTSDEHISAVEALRPYKPLGAILVTTPQEVAVGDVRRELTFCKKMGLRVLGIVENMSGFVCPHCSVGFLVLPGPWGAPGRLGAPHAAVIGSVKRHGGGAVSLGDKKLLGELWKRSHGLCCPTKSWGRAGARAAPCGRKVEGSWCCAGLCWVRDSLLILLLQECTNVFSKGGGEELAKYAGVPFLGCVPLDPQLSQSLEEGRDFIREFPKSSAFPALVHIAQQVLDSASQRSS
ncbi:Nucleotide-binding protein 2 [Aix galericulata]|nr:Nucleotide-binding protein 2 [Aix galericulata]